MVFRVLGDIVIIFAIAVPIIIICQRTRLPSIVGFLLAGMLVGPKGLRLISSIEEVEMFAEFGVVLLLFTIGIELSMRNMMRAKKAVLLGGATQTVLTILLVMGVAVFFDCDLGTAVFYGFLVALSSTAIVMRMLQERGQLGSLHGRTTLAVLVFQDVMIVPMMLITPLLAGHQGVGGTGPLLTLVKGLVIIVAVVVGSQWLVPRLLHQVARTRSRELFLLTIIMVCFATSWLTFSLGLSLALGAFLAGLVISESEYSHHAMGNILPFRDVFASIFFVSIGMLIDLDFLLQNALVVILIILAVMMLKALLASLAALALGLPIKTVVLTGLALCQIGEFSFILSEVGLHHGLLDPEVYQMFLSVTVLTMAITPFVIKAAPRVADLMLRLPWPERLRSGLLVEEKERRTRLKDHLVIVGYGVGGRNVARAARAVGIKYVVVEMNPGTVSEEKKRGERIFFGDASYEAVLKHADVDRARIMVVTIPDIIATRLIVSEARSLNPGLHIVVRTHYLREIESLLGVGADDVVTEEFEASIEMFTMVLVKYLTPRDEIEKLITKVRAEGYRMLRSPARRKVSLADLNVHLSDYEINTFRVCEKSPLAGKTLADLKMRRKYGVTLLAVKRKDVVTANPEAEMKLAVGDILVLIGKPDKIVKVICEFAE